MDVDGYSARAETFATELARSYYRRYAGLGGARPLSALYEAGAELFSAATVAELREASGDHRRLRGLLRFAVEGNLGHATAPLEAELAEREGTIRVAVRGGPPVWLSDVADVQAHEGDAQRRAALEAQRCQAIGSSLAPLAAEILQVRHARARELGWPSYADMYAELGDLDLADLRGQARRFLAATDPSYEAVVDAAARATLGLGTDQLARGDLPRLFRQPALDARFPPGGLVAALTDTMRGFGIELRDQDNLVLDLAPRPSKSRRPFCSPVRVPQEIYLVLSATGGWDDYAALLHEAGHAEHFAAADATLPFELRRLSDPAVGEAFAFLLESIADEPAWLAARGVGEEAVTAARARRLLLLRRYAAKLDYELALHGGELAGHEAAGHYASALSRALRVHWPRATWLTDLDPGLYVVHYLRAWALAEQLRDRLQEPDGGPWFRSPAAGDTLRAWWRDGHGRSAEELLGAPLDFSTLADGFASPAGRR